MPDQVGALIGLHPYSSMGEGGAGQGTLGGIKSGGGVHPGGSPWKTSWGAGRLPSQTSPHYCGGGFLCHAMPPTACRAQNRTLAGWIGGFARRWGIGGCGHLPVDLEGLFGQKPGDFANKNRGKEVSGEHKRLAEQNRCGGMNPMGQSEGQAWVWVCGGLAVGSAFVP